MTERRDNYKIQARQAQEAFLRYDQQKLIDKLHLAYDSEYLYAKMLCKRYRIHRRTANVERMDADWVDANTFEEIMTLLDLICDSREDRYLGGRLKNMQSFGLQFHTNLLEAQRDPWAEELQKNPQGFANACARIGGTRIGNADVAYAIELFDGLCIAICFWLGDEDFPPQVRYFWDENANMYIRYETMYFAVNLLRRRIREEMERQ